MVVTGPTLHPASPASAAARANQDGMAAIGRNDAAAAIVAFTRATTADPASPALWRNLAHACRLGHDDAGEKAALDAALAIDRTDFSAWLRLAQLHQRRGEDRDALIAWNGVLTMADALPAVTGDLAALLEEARAWCAAQTARVAAVLDRDIAPLLPDLPAQDQRRIRAFVDSALGKRRIYTSQCAGLHYPFLPADEFFDDGHFPWFADLAAAAPAIRAEAAALLADPGPLIRPYVRMDAGTPDSIWSALDGQLDWGACFLWEYGAPNDAVLARCPVTAATLAAIPGAVIPGRSPSAFFSVLKPHTRIPPHTGVTNSRAIVHLPLIVPADCGFRVGNERRAWQEGAPFAFDDTIEHEAWNDSADARVILIFDCWNPHLSAAEQAIIARYYTSMDAAVATGAA